MSFYAHPHQHSVKVIGTGGSLEQAFSHALAGLTDPEGHYSRMTFQSFEVTKIAGTVSPAGLQAVQVTLEATGPHKD